MDGHSHLSGPCHKHINPHTYPYRCPDGQIAFYPVYREHTMLVLTGKRKRAAYGMKRVERRDKLGAGTEPTPPAHAATSSRYTKTAFKPAHGPYLFKSIETYTSARFQGLNALQRIVGRL